MEPKHRKLSAALLLISAGIIASASAAAAGGNGKPAPLMIQEQGSFAVGGTVTTAPGTFDPKKGSRHRTEAGITLSGTYQEH